MIGTAFGYAPIYQLFFPDIRGALQIREKRRLRMHRAI